MSRGYTERYEAWAERYDLRQSSRDACPHGLLRRISHARSNWTEHQEWCHRHPVFDHTTLWHLGKRPVVLWSHSYDMLPKREQDVADVATHFGLNYWIGPAEHPLSLYYPGHTTPIMFTPAGLDPAQFGAT
jgi:hypothetical protein